MNCDAMLQRNRNKWRKYIQLSNADALNVACMLEILINILILLLCVLIVRESIASFVYMSLMKLVALLDGKKRHGDTGFTKNSKNDFLFKDFNF